MSCSATRCGRAGCRSRVGGRHAAATSWRRAVVPGQSCGPRSRSAGTAAASSRRADLRRRVEDRPARARSARSSSRSPLVGWDEFELEMMRDRGQRRDRVLDREPRPDGRAHRRLRHGRAADDPRGPRVPGAPRRGRGRRPRRRRRDRRSNIQFARNRDTGELRVIEMNSARLSRSSALASKAMGYRSRRSPRSWPSATRSTRSPNDLTGTTPASFEPAAPRLRRRQVPALRVREVPRRRAHPRDADEVGRRGDGHRPDVHRGVPRRRCGRARSTTAGSRRTSTPGSQRSSSVDPRLARAGTCSTTSSRATGYDSRAGLSDADIAGSVRCGGRRGAPGEAGASALYRRSRFMRRRGGGRARTSPLLGVGEADEAAPAPGRSVVILGSGPNRIGQGIEFDYCCVHAAWTFRRWAGRP